MKTLREEYKERIAAKRFDQVGFVKVACLDDDVPVHMNKQTDEGTMVPRATITGGVLDAPDPVHRRYGEGVTRRTGDVVDDRFKVVSEETGFRPDAGPDDA